MLSFAEKAYKLMTPKTLSVIHLKVGLSCCKLLLGIKLLPYMTTPDLPSYLTRAWMTVYDFLMVVVAHIFLLHVNHSWLLMVLHQRKQIELALCSAMVLGLVFRSPLVCVCIKWWRP